MKKFYILFFAVFSNAIFEIAGDTLTDKEKDYIEGNTMDFFSENKTQTERLYELGFFRGGELVHQSPEIDAIITSMMQTQTNVAISIRESTRGKFLAKYIKLLPHAKEFNRATKRGIKWLRPIFSYYLAYVLPASIDNESTTMVP